MQRKILAAALFATAFPIAAFAQSTTTAHGYFLVEPSAQRTPEPVQRFRQWIVGECKQALAHSPFLEK